jgi:hypothetical protein
MAARHKSDTHQENEDIHMEGELGCGTLETDEVEGKIIGLGSAFLVVGEGINTVEHGGLISKVLVSLTKFSHSTGCSCLRYSRSVTQAS